MAEDQGRGLPKRSLDEMIENMTADLHDSDGQYMQLGFTPPPPTPVTPQHHWTPHSYLPPMMHQPNLPPMYHPDMSRPTEPQQIPATYMNASRSHSQPSMGGIIPGHEMPDANFVNLVYGTPMGLYVLNEQPHNNQGMPQMMNGCVPYRNEGDYGLFMGNSSPSTQTPQERNNALIENLVGNWTSMGSGTYSPFGSVERPVEPPQEERVAPKKRMVAEVRPMRPSYSDIVSKSPPTKPRTISPGVIKMELNNPKTVKVSNKNGKTVGKKGGSGLKRQHSGDEPFKVPSDITRFSSPLPTLHRRRISLDDLEDSTLDEDERPDSAQDSSSQSGDNSTKTNDSDKGTSSARKHEGRNEQPLNNHKASRPGVTKRPLHINNNLNPPSRVGVTEKNLIKAGRPCKTCGEERRGTGSGVSSGNNTKTESKAGSKTRSSSQGRDKPTLHHSRKGKIKKKDNPYSLAALWLLLQLQLLQWGVVALRALAWFLHLLSDVLGMSSRLSWHLFCVVYAKLVLWSGEAWLQLRSLLRLAPPSPHIHGSQRRSRSDPRSNKHHQQQHFRQWLPGWFPRWGRKKKPWEHQGETPTELEANLPLPATGDEAMKRLLACRGKDPYSILGVAPHCSDEEIKRYYKRQAFLVHPDKNSQPGAEEAFKILVHAFDLIGEPEKRQLYDCGVTRSHQAEQAWSQLSKLSELLTQLHEKMEEAANTIRCTNCGKRHKRVAVDRPCYAARMCSQCKIHHSAREGDIWAESTVLGLRWHYYACMDGAVYDITEWAACQADNLRHLRPNTHAVQYRIVLGKKNQARTGSHSQPRRGGPAEPSSGEPDLEDFLNSLYGQSGGSAGARNEHSSPHHQADQARRRKGKRKK